MLILRNHPRIKKSQKSPYLKLKLGTFILLSELTVFVSVKKGEKSKVVGELHNEKEHYIFKVNSP